MNDETNKQSTDDTDKTTSSNLQPQDKPYVDHKSTRSSRQSSSNHHSIKSPRSTTKLQIEGKDLDIDTIAPLDIGNSKISTRKPERKQTQTHTKSTDKPRQPRPLPATWATDKTEEYTTKDLPKTTENKELKHTQSSQQSKVTIEDLKQHFIQQQAPKSTRTLYSSRLKSVNPFIDAIPPRFSLSSIQNSTTSSIQNSSNQSSTSQEHISNTSSEDDMKIIEIARIPPMFNMFSSNIKRRYYQVFNQKFAELSQQYPNIVSHNQEFSKRLFEMDLIDVHTLYYECIDKIKDQRYAYYVKYIYIAIILLIEILGIRWLKLPIEGFTYRCTKSIVYMEDAMIDIGKSFAPKEETGGKPDGMTTIVYITSLQLISVVVLGYLVKFIPALQNTKGKLEDLVDNFIMGKSTLTESFDEFTKYAPMAGNLPNIIGIIGNMFKGKM